MMVSAHLRLAAIRTLTVIILAFALMITSPGDALAHTDESAPLSHVVLESLGWGVGVVGLAMLAALTLWVRVKIRGRQ